MERLLTTKDLQQILQVDRITIYRMLDSGELPGIKVGGQWRFPEPAVNDWLQGIKSKQTGNNSGVSVVAAQPPVDPREESSRTPRLTDIVSNVCLQNIQDGFAEAVDVASLVIDLEGTPLTKVSNGCSFCRLGWSSEEFRRRCSASWASLAPVEEERPQVHLCHAGIGYAVAPVQVHGERVGLVVGGQFWSERPDQERVQATAERLAVECGLPAPALIEAMESVPVFGEERVFLMTKLLATIADTLSEIGFQAYEVRQKLQQIAQIVKTL
jgi:excisionase family DNA binding protein